MKSRTWIALAVSGALAVPVLVHAQAGGPAGTSAQGSGVTGGVPRTGGPGPGMASMGEPQDFNTMDRDSDGRISRAEWDDHYRRGGSAAAGGTSPANPATTDRTPASAPTGATAGPGTVSPRTGPGSATATQPSTSGHGKPQ
jgi:hypothetical protein